VVAVLAFPALVALGTLGYMVIEGWSFSDAMFMAATTITTIGFGEVRPLSEAGRLYTIGLLVVGLAAVWYALGTLVSAAVEVELGLNLEGRRMERQVQRVRGHHVVAGFGRVGRQTALALRDLGRQVVAVDADPAAVREATGLGILVVEGNATEDDTLARAGIDRAAGLLAALGDDADNIYVVLSARALHPTLPIVARANEASAVGKLARAGATQVVSPYDAASRQMARLALRPGTVGFVEDLFQAPSAALMVEDVRVDPGSPLAGMSIGEVRRRVPHAGLIAVLRAGQTLSPLGEDFRLEDGDQLAAFGAEPNLRLLETLSQRRGG
jgi:voltage-gated potassium channel